MASGSLDGLAGTSRGLFLRRHPLASAADLVAGILADACRTRGSSGSVFSGDGHPRWTHEFQASWSWERFERP